MFIKLGLINIRRQMSRSVLVLMAMFLAAISLTSALSMSQGRPAEAASAYTAFFGGDILVLPLKWAGHSMDDITSNQELEFSRLQPDGFSWMELIYPELYEQGYLALQGKSPTLYFSQEQLNALGQNSLVEAVNVLPQMPGRLVYNHKGQQLGRNAWIMQAGTVPLRDIRGNKYDQQMTSDSPIARVAINAFVKPPRDEVLQRVSQISDEEADATLPRPVGEEAKEYGQDVIRITKERMAVRTWSKELPTPGPDDASLLQVPSLKITDQAVLADYSVLAERTVTPLAYTALATRTVFYPAALGWGREQGYLHAPIIWVPQTLWTELWQDATTGSAPVYSNVSLKVKDMSRLEQTVVELQQQFPNYTFVSVASLVHRLESMALLDYFYAAPEWVWRFSRGGTLGFPIQLGKLIGVLMFLVAGMLIASRMLTGAAQRSREIGVLKALGARRRDIIQMTMTEALVLAVLGTGLGTFIAKLAGIYVQINNSVPLSEIASNLLSEVGLVTGVAVAVSMLFAYIPATRMARLTAMEVLRNE